MKKLSISMTHRENRFGLICLLLQLFCLPSLLAFGNRLLARPLSESLVNLVYFALSFSLIVLVYYRFLLVSLRYALGNLWKTLRYAFLGFLLYQISGYLLNMAIFAWMPDFFNVNDASIANMGSEHFGLVAMCIVFLVPVTEETLYRGFIFRWLYERNHFAAYLLSALLFAAIHVMGYIGLFPPVQLLFCLIQYLPAGFCLAWAYVKADTIWAPILVHIAVNQIGVTAMR